MIIKFFVFFLLSISSFAQTETPVSECSGQGKPIGRRGKVTGCMCHGVIYGFNEESNPCRQNRNREVLKVEPNVVLVDVSSSSQKLPETCDLIPLPKVPDVVAEVVTVTSLLEKDVKLDGKIFDAHTGLPVNGAKVTLEGENKTYTGLVINGFYQFGEVPPGDYTLKAEVEGYTVYENTFTMPAEKITKNVSFVSDTFAVDSIIITVTWGKVPIDIDSELRTGKFLLDWRSLHANYNSTDKKPRAMLDLDDVDGFGPETTVIKVDKDGNTVSKKPYSFYVYNYTGEPVSMKNSEVEVNVIKNGKQIFYMRSSEIKDEGMGRMWHVFDIIKGQLVVRDEILNMTQTSLKKIKPRRR